jgi:hypothetical protein
MIPFRAGLCLRIAVESASPSCIGTSKNEGLRKESWANNHTN